MHKDSKSLFFAFTGPPIDQAEPVHRIAERFECWTKVTELEKQVKGGKSDELEFRVGEKGGVSVYGLGRFPVTLYYEQWVRLLAEADLEFVIGWFCHGSSSNQAPRPLRFPWISTGRQPQIQGSGP